MEGGDITVYELEFASRSLAARYFFFFIKKIISLQVNCLDVFRLFRVVVASMRRKENFTNLFK